MRAALAGLALAPLLWACAAPAGEGAQPIGAEELAARIAAGSAPVVLDVRSREEFARGHIPGAVNLPHDELAGRLSEIPGQPSDEIVVHCQSGRRASQAEGVLREHGYSNVRDLTGHWRDWQAAGLPSE